MKNKILILDNKVDRIASIEQALESNYKIYTKILLEESYDLIVTNNINFKSDVLSLLIVEKNNISVLKNFNVLGFCDYLLWPAVKEDINARVALQLQNKNLHIDELTKINNRSFFDKIIHHYCTIKQNFSLLMMDLDFFKHINDEYGHLAGDEALLSVAQIVKVNLRPFDFVARFGGDEFAIILPETTIDNAYFVAERLRKIINQECNFTVSFGISHYINQEHPKSLIKRADDALLFAKNNGKNVVVKEK